MGHRVSALPSTVTICPVCKARGGVAGRVVGAQQLGRGTHMARIEPCASAVAGAANPSSAFLWLLIATAGVVAWGFGLVDKRDRRS